jgi:hypothetical protein
LIEQLVGLGVGATVGSGVGGAVVNTGGVGAPGAFHRPSKGDDLSFYHERVDFLWVLTYCLLKLMLHLRKTFLTFWMVYLFQFGGRHDLLNLSNPSRMLTRILREQHLVLWLSTSSLDLP